MSGIRGDVEEHPASSSAIEGVSVLLYRGVAVILT